MNRQEWLAQTAEWKKTGKKKCLGCEQEKLASDFEKNGKYLSARCRPCKLIQTKAWREKNRHRYSSRLRYNLLNRYGISSEKYGEMLAAQDGKCAVCRGDVSWGRRNFSVDHDHDTGKVRGLLCSYCNTAIGHLKDSLPNLQRAMDYLRSYGAKWS
tara:strand:+ start:43 stop:510 length:468 start_codon:yes stop_codon:yes gene_type:complete